VNQFLGRSVRRLGRVARIVSGAVLRRLTPMDKASDVLATMRAFPVAEIDELTGRGPLLVITPHPDDESLGCGGVIAEARTRGHTVRLVLVTDGAASHPGSRSHPPPILQRVREGELLAAAAVLGVPAECVDMLRLPDGQAPWRGRVFEDVASRLSELVRTHAVATICTTWPRDPHTDHVAAFRLGRAAARATGAKLFLYPVWGWTLSARLWLPRAPIDGFRIDVSKQLAVKRAAIDCHRSQTGRLIDDDPSGFVLTPEFRALFEQRYETFLRTV